MLRPWLMNRVFSRVPNGISDESDLARLFAHQLNSPVSEGLGLKVPVDINIEQYIEIIGHFRPKLIKLNQSVIG